MRACAIDLQAFSLTAQAAQNADQLRDLMVRTLGAAGVPFLQLVTYRRSRFEAVVWSEFADDVGRDVCGSQVEDAIACRAITSGRPQFWDCVGAEVSTRGKGVWRKALFENGVSAGATIAIRGADEWCYIFHFGAQDNACFDVGHAGISVFSTLGFIASQHLMMWQPKTAGTPVDATLSVRELEVIRWCKDGKSYPEIAQILGISSKTVEFHIANAMRKLGVNQKISAIIEAARLGLIEL